MKSLRSEYLEKVLKYCLENILSVTGVTDP